MTFRLWRCFYLEGISSNQFTPALSGMGPLELSDLLWQKTPTGYSSNLKVILWIFLRNGWDLGSTFIPYDLGLKQRQLDFFFLVLKFWTIRGLSHEQLDPIPLLGRIKLPQKCYLGFIPAPITPFSPPSACNSIYFDDSMVGDLFSLSHQYKEVQSIELHCTRCRRRLKRLYVVKKLVWKLCQFIFFKCCTWDLYFM